MVKTKSEGHYLARFSFAEGKTPEELAYADIYSWRFVGDLDYILSALNQSAKHGTVKGVRLCALKKKTGKKRLFEKSEKKEND